MKVIVRNRVGILGFFCRKQGKAFRPSVACCRRSDSRARAKNKASETAGKKRGETGEEDEGTPVKLILKNPCRCHSDLGIPVFWVSPYPNP